MPPDCFTTAAGRHCFWCGSWPRNGATPRCPSTLHERPRHPAQPCDTPKPGRRRGWGTLFGCLAPGLGAGYLPWRWQAGASTGQPASAHFYQCRPAQESLWPPRAGELLGILYTLARHSRVQRLSSTRVYPPCPVVPSPQSTRLGGARRIHSLNVELILRLYGPSMCQMPRHNQPRGCRVARPFLALRRGREGALATGILSHRHTGR